jgi:hypothetical protein
VTEPQRVAREWRKYLLTRTWFGQAFMLNLSSNSILPGARYVGVQGRVAVQLGNQFIQLSEPGIRSICAISWSTIERSRPVGQCSAKTIRLDVVRQIPQSSHFFDSPVCARQLIAPSGCSLGGPTITEVARGPGSLLKRMRKRSHPACSISLPISDERDLAVNPKQCKPRQCRT